MNEVSVLLPSSTPAEPLAQVVLLRDAPEFEREGEIIHTGGGRLRRNCGTILGVR